MNHYPSIALSMAAALLLVPASAHALPSYSVVAASGREAPETEAGTTYFTLRQADP